MPNFPRRAGSLLLAPVLCVVFASLASAQGTDEQTAACSGDAFTLCRADIPNVEKITACMKAHEAQLSPRCRALFHTEITRQKAPTTQASKAPARAPVVEKRAPAVARVTEHPTIRHAEGQTVPHPRRKTVVDETRMRAPAPAPAAQVVAPAAPAPERLPGLAAYRANVVSSCHKGLIDPYTCRSTLDALSLIE